MNAAIKKFTPSVELHSPRVDTARVRTDAELGIREIEALRLDADLVAPPEAAHVAEPLVDLYRGEVSSGDELRLPSKVWLDRANTQSALSRILELDGDVGPQEALMLGVLRAYSAADRILQEKARTGVVSGK